MAIIETVRYGGIPWRVSVFPYDGTFTASVRVGSLAQVCEHIGTGATREQAIADAFRAAGEWLASVAATVENVTAAGCCPACDGGR